MADDATLVISFKDVEVDEDVREMIAKRWDLLVSEFPEVNRLAMTLEPDEKAGFTGHAHITGRNLETDTHGNGAELRQAVDAALDKAERQLRKVHDKRIFAQRREAQKSPPKRKLS